MLPEYTIDLVTPTFLNRQQGSQYSDSPRSSLRSINISVYTKAANMSSGKLSGKVAIVTGGGTSAISLLQTHLVDTSQARGSAKLSLPNS